MKRRFLKTMIVLLASLAISACNDDNKNYPADYVGFEKSAETYSYDAQNKEETITIKVMAVNKKDEDRKVKLTTNKSSIFGGSYTLSQNEVIIKAGEKSVKATIKLYPDKILKGTNIQVVCTPLWKNAESSQLNIKLRPK